MYARGPVEVRKIELFWSGKSTLRAGFLTGSSVDKPGRNLSGPGPVKVRSCLERVRSGKSTQKRPRKPRIDRRAKSGKSTQIGFVNALCGVVVGPVKVRKLKEPDKALSSVAAKPRSGKSTQNQDGRSVFLGVAGTGVGEG